MAEPGKSQSRSRKHPVEGFVKETGAPASGKPLRDAGFRKAARFLMLLGKEEAARVLKHLAPEEVEGIALEIAKAESIDSREASKILEEFGYIRETKDLIARGGIEKAREMLVAALGADKAERILERVRREMAPPPFSFLQDIDPHQAAAVVAGESPAVTSLILAHLEPRTAARILTSLPPDVRAEVALRIAKLGVVDPEVVRRTEEALREKVRRQGEAAARPIDGRTALTEILRYIDPGKERTLLEALDAETAGAIRRKLYTLDMVLRIPDKSLQQILRDYADREIALMLKVAEGPVAERLLSSVSERRREFIRQESEAIGEVRRSEADRAVEEFLGYIQLLEQKGELAVLREDEGLVE